MLSLTDWEEIYEEMKTIFEKSIKTHQDRAKKSTVDKQAYNSLYHVQCWYEYLNYMRIFNWVDEEIRAKIGTNVMLSLNDWNEIYEETKKGLEKLIERHKVNILNNIKIKNPNKVWRYSGYWAEHTNQLGLLDELNERIREKMDEEDE